ERKARERLAKLMGFETLDDFERMRRRHTQNVRAIYDRLLKSDAPTLRSPLPLTLENAEADWKKLLAAHAFRDPDKARHTVKEFIKGTGYVHVSARPKERARKLFTRSPQFAPGPSERPVKKKQDETEEQSSAPGKVLSDPDRVLVRLDSFIAAY